LLARDGPAAVGHPVAPDQVLSLQGAAPAAPAVAAAAEEAAAKAVPELVGDAHALAAVQVHRLFIGPEAAAFQHHRIDAQALQLQRHRDARGAGADDTHGAGHLASFVFLTGVNEHGAAPGWRSAGSQSPHAQARGLERMRVEHGLHVDHAAALHELAAQVLARERGEAAVRNRHHQGLGARQVAPLHQLHAVFVPGFLRVGLGVVHAGLDAVVGELVNDVDDLAVAQVGAVFLEGEAEDVDPRALDVAARGDHLLDRLLGDELAHAVVDAPTGQDHLRVIAQHLGLVREVVGVHADAVPAHEAGPELEEVPLRAGGLQHLAGVDADLVEDDGQLVHERDVQVALRVLDDLAGLGRLDARAAVDAGLHHALVEPCDALERVGRVAGDDLHHAGQLVLAVARVDALGAVADEEVALPREARGLLEDRDAHLLGGARVDGGFVDHDGAGLQVRADGAARAGERAEVGA